MEFCIPCSIIYILIMQKITMFDIYIPRYRAVSTEIIFNSATKIDKVKRF